MLKTLTFQNRTRFAEVERSATFPLVVRDLVLRFGETTVLNRLSFNLSASGCTMILGPNGSGKSLLLRLLHGLIAPSSGTIHWGDSPLQQMTARQALVFQKPVLLRRSVGANIDFVLKARKKSLTERDTHLENVGLLQKADQPARLLSGGEAQRLALARALATHPDILFLDEPTASLDPASVLAIEEITNRARARGVKIIFVTHDMGQARRLADDIVFLHRGDIQEHSPAQDFFSKPKSEAARDYLNGRILL